MKNNKLSLLLGLCLVVVTSTAQEVLTKAEAINHVLDNNYGIKIAENNVEISENNTSILNSGYLPTLSTNFGFDFSLQDRLAEVEGQDPIDQTDLETRRYNTSLDFNYTLFDGLGRRYNFKQLKLQYNLSKLEARETIETTITQMFTVYYELARRLKNVEVLKNTLSLSRERLKRVEYQFQYGQINKLDVLNAEVDVANDSISLINEQQNLFNIKRDLKVVLNEDDLDDNFKVDTTVRFLPILKLEQYISEYKANNVSIQQIEENLLISEYDKKISYSGYLPTVNLFGSYGWNRNISPESPFFPGSTQTTDGYSAGVNLTWNLFDGGQTSVRIQNAKIAYENQQLQKEQIKQNVQRDIQNAFDNYKNRRYIYNLQRKNVETNKNNFKRTQERFKLGQVTSVEFRQAQLNLLNAQTSLNLAKYDAKLAELQLLQLTGQLLNVEF
ncbi:Outer membrane protein TolC [Psychroflexus salarius]|uniref:Outer membrane protein TolC n=1 Tax=Psychroflexus salarius TaxID=1155689 RepID=A0A1M4U690_9FLAO|nr:TolC family protein [Psychroflexus salarius]SHE52351.1 Outer membrane protein TolC [Psychroflexus salarius]